MLSFFCFIAMFVVVHVVGLSPNQHDSRDTAPDTATCDSNCCKVNGKKKLFVAAVQHEWNLLDHGLTIDLVMAAIIIVVAAMRILNFQSLAIVDFSKKKIKIKNTLHLPATKKHTRVSNSERIKGWWIQKCVMMLLLVSSCHSVTTFMTDECHGSSRMCNPRYSVDAILDGTPGDTLFDRIVLKYGPMEDWDMSHVTHLDYLFKDKTFNIDISKWDISGVTSMRNSTFFLRHCVVC